MLVDQAARVLQPHHHLVLKRGDAEHRADLLAQRTHRSGAQIAAEVDDVDAASFAAPASLALAAARSLLAAELARRGDRPAQRAPRRVDAVLQPARLERDRVARVAPRVAAMARITPMATTTVMALARNRP